MSTVQGPWQPTRSRGEEVIRSQASNAVGQAENRHYFTTDKSTVLNCFLHTHSGGAVAAASAIDLIQVNAILESGSLVADCNEGRDMRWAQARR